MQRTRGIIALLGGMVVAAGLAFASPAAEAAIATIPGAPTSLSATPGDTTVVLSWTAPANNGGSPVTGYNVYEGTASGAENYSVPVNGSTPVTATTDNVTGLTNSSTYYFTVKSVNAVGSSAASNEAWAIPADTVPGAAANVVASAADVSATVTWNAPADPGGSIITGYTVKGADATVASRGGQSCTWTSGPLTCTVTGLTNGDSYTFTVTATNSLGTGPASTPSNAVVPAVTAPAAPTNFVATPGNTTVVLSWTAPANGGSAISGYNLYEGTSSGGESATPVNTSPIATTTATVTGLTNGTKYYFIVKALNATGSSPASGETWAIPAGTAPGAPTGVSATAGYTSATVIWTAPADEGGSAINRYTVTALDSTSSSRGGQSCTWTAGPLSCVVTGLTNGDLYTFTVTATNSVGTGVASAASNSAVPALSVPSAPMSLAAVPGNHKVVLTWSAPANGGAAIEGYNLYEGTSPGGENYGAPVNGGVRISGTTATVSGLLNADTYYFTAEAVNGVGSSAPSNEVWAIPDVTTAGAPQDVKATAGTNGTAAVSWTPPLSAGGSAVSAYVVTPYLGTTAGASKVFDSTATTETLTGLDPGTAYSFAVAAINAAGNGETSALSNIVDIPRAYTHVVLSLSSPSVTYGNELVEHFAVTVSPNYSGPVPTGTVSIKKSTTTLCVVTLSAATGSCSLTSAELPARTFSVYAVYARNSSFVGATSFKTKTVLTVAKAPTKTTLTLSSSKITFGHEQTERLSVSVSPQYSGAAPTGAVTISGTPCVVRLSAGKGSCTLKSRTFHVGSHSPVAHYWGSPSYNGSLSAPKSLSIAG